NLVGFGPGREDARLIRRIVASRPAGTAVAHHGPSGPASPGPAHGRDKRMIGPLGENLIFAISQPRAGSTLLQRILSGHPEIFATAEPWIMLHPLYALRDGGYQADYNAEWARAALQDFCAQLEGGEQAYVEAVRAMGVLLYNQALRPSNRGRFL